MATQPIYLLATGLVPAELIEGAAAKGIVLDMMSFIATEPVDDEEMGARIKALGDRGLTAVFTSMNAVEAVKEWMEEAPDWRIFCIGGATRRAVADYFGKGAIAGTAESATVLAELVMKEADGKEIFFFCGDQRRDELPNLLKEAGLTVHETIVYRTRQTPRKTERAYAGIAFFSPSAVESFFTLNSAADGVILFAIGQTTAAAIQARCPNAVIISDRPGKDPLVHIMTDYFQKNNKE